jgi:hypothetical protein
MKEAYRGRGADPQTLPDAERSRLWLEWNRPKTGHRTHKKTRWRFNLALLFGRSKSLADQNLVWWLNPLGLDTVVTRQDLAEKVTAG